MVLDASLQPSDGGSAGGGAADLPPIPDGLPSTLQLGLASPDGRAEYTREIAPLTHDRVTLKGLLKYVSPRDNQMGGTNLAAAIAQALSLFDVRVGRDLDVMSHAQRLVAITASILERLAAYHKEIEFFGAGREELIESCARILFQTVTGRAAP